MIGNVRIETFGPFTAMVVEVGILPDGTHALVLALDDVDDARKLSPLLSPATGDGDEHGRWLELAIVVGTESTRVPPPRAILRGIDLARRVTATFELGEQENAQLFGTLLYQRIRFTATAAAWLPESRIRGAASIMNESRPDPHHIGLGIATAWANLRAARRAEPPALHAGDRIEHVSTGRFGDIVSVRRLVERDARGALESDETVVVAAIDGSPHPLAAPASAFRVVTPAQNRYPDGSPMPMLACASCINGNLEPGPRHAERCPRYRPSRTIVGKGSCAVQWCEHDAVPEHAFCEGHATAEQIARTEPSPSAEQVAREHEYFNDPSHDGDGDEPGFDDGPWHDGDGWPPQGRT